MCTDWVAGGVDSARFLFIFGVQSEDDGAELTFLWLLWTTVTTVRIASFDPANIYRLHWFKQSSSWRVCDTHQSELILRFQIAANVRFTLSDSHVLFLHYQKSGQVQESGCLDSQVCKLVTWWCVCRTQALGRQSTTDHFHSWAPLWNTRPYPQRD